MAVSSAARPDYAAHSRAVRASFPEVVGALREILGLKLCAYLGVRSSIDRNGKAPFPGLFVSRPVSRILSRVTISLGRPLQVGSSGVPGSSAGRVVGTCFTLHRTGFGEPPCHHGAGGLLPHRFTHHLCSSRS